MQKVNENLKKAWAKRKKFKIKSDELFAKGNNFWEISKRCKSSTAKNIFFAKANEFWRQGCEFWITGDRLWARAILREYGRTIKVEWKNYNKEKRDYECYLNEQIFIP